MMPIMLGYAESIPENMRQYIPLLAACPISRQEFDKIGYLTIHESTIETDGKSQRRGGVHTETPGKVFLQATDDCSLPEVSLQIVHIKFKLNCSETRFGSCFACIP